MSASSQDTSRGFLGVHFVKCNVYGRLYLNAKKNAYEGNCPKCGRRFRVRIGDEGTSQRFFIANCYRA